ncbi:hypothetical protein N7454_006255 [Penicillium verhagenii]|nr:hypothetical protein N7454_006255 [Penicillium verhagenii]
MFCQELIEQLSHLGDPVPEDHSHSSDGTRQNCLPRVLTTDGCIVMEEQRGDGGATNVDQWVTDLAERCPSCVENCISIDE